MQTNSTDKINAATLAELASNDQGTLLAARVHKMGSERGPKSRRVVYGDDTSLVVIWTGFKYRALIARSQKMLDREIQRGGYIEKLARRTLEEHEGATIEDVCEAIQETRDWFRRVMAGGGAPSGEPVGSVWEPLVVDGKVVRGSRVYTGPARPDQIRAPKPGTIYVQGVKLGEKLITPAANGPWRPDSKPKTLAKNLMKETLPVGLYCQYRLEPERVRDVAVGQDAVRMAKDYGVYIDPESLISLFKVAP